jgi:hypothetical protein
MAAMPEALSKERLSHQRHAQLKGDSKILMANQISFNDARVAHTLGRL